MPSLPSRRIAASVVGVCLVTSMSAQCGSHCRSAWKKPRRSAIAAGTYRTLVFGVVDGDKSEVVVFGTLDNGKAPDGDTVYEIGSITKTFTATLLAEAVLAGRVTLDTPVARLLPDFNIPSRGGNEITLGELATQNSGLPRLPSNLLPKDPENPYADYDAAKLKAFLAGYELPRDPGAAYEYSNLGFGISGICAGASAHMTYGVLTAQEIFKPLGMTMSGMALTDAMRAHLAPGHNATGRPVKNWDFDAMAGAGAIRSTANDMLRYLRANMGIDSSPLTAAMKFAQQPRRRRDPHHAHRPRLDDDRQRDRLAQWRDRRLCELHRLHGRPAARRRHPHRHGRSGRRSRVCDTRSGGRNRAHAQSDRPARRGARGLCRDLQACRQFPAEGVSHERRTVCPGDRARPDPDLSVRAQRVFRPASPVSASASRAIRAARSTDSCCTRTATAKLPS